MKKLDELIMAVVAEMPYVAIGAKEREYSAPYYMIRVSIGERRHDGLTSYMGFPTIVPSDGIIIEENGRHFNFFSHNGAEFETTRDVNEFVEMFKKNNNEKAN